MGIMSNTWVRAEYRVESVIGHCPNICITNDVIGMLHHWNRVVGLALAITCDATTAYALSKAI